MAKSKRAQAQDEDQAVDQYGRPLPLVVMVDKAGNEVEVRDAAGLSSMHYGHGMSFADEDMSYAKALAVILGDQAAQVLVEVPADGGDVVWPTPQVPGSEDSESDGKSGKSDAKSG